MTGDRGLRHYLAQKAGSMRAAASERPEAGAWRETVRATCRADDATGTRKLAMGDWRLTGDSGPAFGGWGLGPSSPELLCGVVATCLTHTYLIGAANMGIALDAVEVEVTAENNDARFLGIETEDPPLPWGITAHVRIEAEGTPDAELDRLHEYARRECPLTQLIRQPNDVTIVVES